MKTHPKHYHSFKHGYVSDFEKFIDGYMEQHPEVQEDQQHGWYIWWDHRLDLAELDKLRDNEVPAKPYQYE